MAIQSKPNRLKSFIKGEAKKIRQLFREKQLASTVEKISPDRLIKEIRNLGITNGDVVFVHSSLKRLGFVEGGPTSIFKAFMEVVGAEGTLVIPTYYLPGGTILATCNMPDYVFDPRVHGSNLGAIPEAFLRWPGVERSLHPTHSVSAVGKHASYITEHHHLAPSIFGTGSPWDRVTELNGKVLGLGISMGPVTYYHILEDRSGPAFPLPVRMSKQYSLPVLDFAGGAHKVPVVPLDPEFMSRRIDHPSRTDLRDYFWREFRERGLLKTGPVGKSTSWYIESSKFYSHLHELMLEGITIYSTPAELLARPN